MALRARRRDKGGKNLTAGDPKFGSSAITAEALIAVGWKVRRQVNAIANPARHPKAWIEDVR